MTPVESIPSVRSADLRNLIAHRESVQATDAMEDVHKHYASRGVDFMAVLDGGKLVGLCARQQVGMALGARFGFALYSRKPIREAMLPTATSVRVGDSLAEVLKKLFSRPDETFFDDVALVNDAGEYQGLIFARALVRLQHALLLENIGRLEEHQREIDNKNAQMEEDLRMAREIQQALLPQHYPCIQAHVLNTERSLHFAHCYHPAAMVSGDFFYVLGLSDHVAGVFICDVMGHGVRAAFVTAMLCTLVETLRQLANNPGELLTRMNAELRSILKQTDSPMFATAFYLVADVRTGQIRYAKAGHPNPLRLNRDQSSVEPLRVTPGTQGPPLGLLDGSRYGSNEGALGAGDLLFFYTDGLQEVFDEGGREFGDRGLQASIVEWRSLAIDSLLKRVVSDARAFSADGVFPDDVCLVGMEFTETPANANPRS